MLPKRETLIEEIGGNMPPKVKYTREQILDAAVELTRERGIAAVTARELGQKLGISAKPIFLAFENMDDVRKAVRDRARDVFHSYMNSNKEYQPRFKKYGMEFIRFAKEEPELFKVLFMRTDYHAISYLDAVNEATGDTGENLKMVMDDFDLTEEIASKVIANMWIQGYGIAVLSAQGIYNFSDDEVSRMLSEVFVGQIAVWKSPALQERVAASAVVKGEKEKLVVG